MKCTGETLRGIGCTGWNLTTNEVFGMVGLKCSARLRTQFGGFRDDFKRLPHDISFTTTASHVQQSNYEELLYSVVQ